jgi:hypothetical protein
MESPIFSGTFYGDGGADTIPRERFVPLRDLLLNVLLTEQYEQRYCFLDLKTPLIESDANAGQQVARRMARQLMEITSVISDDHQHEALLQRLVLMDIEFTHLECMREEFAADRRWATFRNFCYDNESLNSMRSGDKIDSMELIRDTEHRFLSLGVPVSPVRAHSFDDFVNELRRLRTALDTEGRGRRLVCWTLNDDRDVDAVFGAADVIITDRPESISERWSSYVEHLSTGSDLSLTTNDTGAESLLKAPLVIAHRGGPDSLRSVENSWQRIQTGIAIADGIEVDVCSCTDGLLLFHDNDPNSVVSFARSSGIEADQRWRITNSW